MNIEYALNPLQWIATDDGWIKPSIAPDLDHQLDVAASAGFERIQPSLPANMSVPDYRRALDRHGLSAGPGYVVLRLPDEPLAMRASDRTALAAESRTAVRQLAELGSTVVFVGLGMTRDAPRVRRAAVGSDFDSDRLEIVRDTVGAVAESMVVEADVAVALHPHVGTWVETDEETRYLLDSIDDTVLGFGPDIGHLYWAGADVPHLIHDFGDRVRGIHLKDYSKDIATRARTAGWSYQATVLAGVWREPGTGTEDLTGMLANLPADWSGPVVIEVDRAAAETPERSIALCGGWMKSQQNDYAPPSSRR